MGHQRDGGEAGSMGLKKSVSPSRFGIGVLELALQRGGCRPLIHGFPRLAWENVLDSVLPQAVAELGSRMR